MNAEIVATGSELVLGETVDTNSSYLARQLAAMGITLLRTTAVGDSEAHITAAVGQALDRAELVVCTGGLGPTPDDRTREAVASAVGRPLVFHQHLLDQIEARFRSFGRTMSESNRQQAYVPEGARIVENPRGTAPSFIVEIERGTVAVLPGVPSEMRYLWEHALVPYLRDERGATGVILVRTLHAAGQSESVIGELIADLMMQENPNVGISAKRAQYELRIVAQSDSRAGAEALAEQAAAIIRERLGQYLLGDERLEQLVARLLAERGLSLALYEGNDRAPVYRAITAMPAGRAALRGAIIHPLDRPADDAAAEMLARSGATTVLDRWRADLALGVQAASAPGDDGFTNVALALAHPGGMREWRRRYDLNLEDGWEFIGTLALDALRQHLLGQE
ncbi:MAG: competence/damage-inducible protein A [Roseiflexaceae bacterium]